jgi:hypothetical protein
VTYVALGSSYAAGPGVGETTDVGCGRGADSYPELLADELSLDLVNVACSGATVDKVVDEPQDLPVEGPKSNHSWTRWARTPSW